MHVIRRHATLCSVVAGLAFWGLVGTASPAFAKVGGKKKPPTPQKVEDHTLIKELRSTRHLISLANHNYKGHRARAMEEIGHAIHQLEKDMHRRNHPHTGKGEAPKGGKEPQGDSDAQLKAGIGQLQTILGQLASLPATNHRTKAAVHIKAAIQQLELALAVNHKAGK